jgi:hypothetical protein
MRILIFIVTLFWVLFSINFCRPSLFHPNKKGARIKIQPRLNPISYEKPSRYNQK